MRARIALLCASTTIALYPAVAMAQSETGQAQPPAQAQPPEATENKPGGAQVTTPPNGDSGFQDIIVTARRQSESAQNVPISIIAVDEKSLQEKGIRTANDLPQVAAGLSVQNTSARKDDTTFSIRGQGQTFGQNSPGVVAYFADVPDLATQIYDLENVQVLKGPQGTLFGRNTTGGAVLFVPRKPGNELNGFVLGRFGEYGRRDVEGAIGGALIKDKIMVRVSGQLLRRDGYTHNIFNNTDTDDENKLSLRASLVIRPVDWFESYTIYQYAKVDESGSGVSIGGYDPTNANIAPLGSQIAALIAAQRARGPRIIDVDYPLSNGLVSSGVVNTTSISLGEHVTLKNIYSIRRSRTRVDFELDGSRLPLLQDHIPYGRLRQRTEEVQAQGHWGILQGTVGYYDEKRTTPSQVGFDVIEYITPIGPIHAINHSAASDNTSRAFYGEFTVIPIESVSLTGGIRRTTDFRSAGSRTDVITPFGTQLGTATFNSGTFKATTWNLNALYKVTPDLNTYVTVRRGYKSGGFNGTALNAADQFFRPETVTDYEAGVKYSARVGGVRVRTNVDLFYDDYKDIQRYVNLATSPPSTVTRNAASGTIYGLDADVMIAPSPIFDLTVRYSYLHAKYGSYTDAALGDLSNSRFPNSPTHQLNVVPRFTIPTAAHAGQITLQSNIYYQSLIAFDPANVLNGNPAVAISVPGATAPGYARFDLRIDWHRVMGSPISLAAYVRNVTDKVYITGSNNQLPSFAGVVSYLYGEPRMIGGEVRVDF